MEDLLRALPLVAAYGIGVGLCTTALNALCRRAWGVEMQPARRAVLAGATVGFLAGFGIRRGNVFAILSALAILLGAFAVRVIASKLSHPDGVAR